MIPLRIDDVGACSKRYERHADKWIPYREMNAYEIVDFAAWLRQHDSSATIAITARWVERDGRAVAFHDKFPEQAEAWAIGVRAGVFEIASHGLTHCIPGPHFSWALWRNNRRWHREFTPDLPFEEQMRHLWESRSILQEYFETPVTTLVPPGNAISERTARAALDMGYDLVTCRNPHGWPSIVDDSAQLVVHDRDVMIVKRHMDEAFGDGPFCTVRQAVKVNA